MLNWEFFQDFLIRVVIKLNKSFAEMNSLPLSLGAFFCCRFGFFSLKNFSASLISSSSRLVLSVISSRYGRTALSCSDICSDCRWAWRCSVDCLAAYVARPPEAVTIVIFATSFCQAMSEPASFARIPAKTIAVIIARAATICHTSDDIHSRFAFFE